MVEDPDKAPSLEPPSLFRRKKKSAPPAPRPPAAEPGPPVEAPPVEAPPVEAPPDAPDEAVAGTPDDPPARAVMQPETTAVAVAEPPAGPAPVDETPTTIVDDTSQPSPDVAAAEPEEPQEPREPWLSGRPAAAVTGLLVGAVIVAATSGSLRICTALKGTSSCGGPGFFLLVAILVVAVLVGAAMLRSARVPEPGSTSFLAVGLLSVVALLFLVGSIFQWWMAIVIPLVSTATFLLSHWVTTTYIEPS